MCLRERSFAASMLTMAVFAVYLAIVRHQPNNIGGGILTFYLIGTAWLTARRRDGETSRLDWVVLLIPLALGILTWMNGLKVMRSGATSQDGVPVGMTFFMGPSNRPLRLLSRVGLGQHLSPALFSTTLYLISHHTSADLTDFLASPSTLHKRIQGKAGTNCVHKS
jgi:hypothetical protein